MLILRKVLLDTWERVGPLRTNGDSSGSSECREKRAMYEVTWGDAGEVSGIYQ